VIPLGMTTDELVNGFRALIHRIADDAAIHARIRTKLHYLDPPFLPFELPPRTALSYLFRFLVKGIALGGPRRWSYFARSLLPALRRPRVLPFVVLNWTYGIAIQSFVKEHLRSLEAHGSGAHLGS
jgi:hypothetical protein